MGKRLSTVALVATFALGFGVTALAHGTDGPNANTNLDASTTGADWDGTREWYPPSHHQGAFHYWGDLFDSGCDDGDNVYTKVRPEGYAYESFYGDEACDGQGDNQEGQNVWTFDPQQTRTNNADWAVCRDKNFPLSDNCTDRHFSR